MDWIICFLLSVSVLVFSVVFAVVVSAGKYKRGRVLTPFNIVFGGVFISVFICLLPINRGILAGTTSVILKTVTFSLHNAFQIFTINAERRIIIENIVCSEKWLSAAYSAYLSAAYVIAPIFTLGFLISLFKDVSSYVRYFLNFFCSVYVFSELNERSLPLGADIRKNHKRALIIYTDVFDKGDGITEDLIERSRELNAICFKKDVLDINFKVHGKKSNIIFFTVGEDESRNTEQALQLIKTYNKRENTGLYVFSSRIESEIMLNKASKGKIKVRRVNRMRSLIYELIEEHGNELFDTARETASGKKMISAVIIGLGKYGTEMLKALSWYCQMDGYGVETDAFDVDEKALERFTASAPDLMSDRYNGVVIPGEAEYTIRIHPGCDVTTSSFAEQIQKMKNTTYVFVSLGTDEANVKTSIYLRTLFERAGIKPVIRSVVYNINDKNALNGITNFRGQAYDIGFVGDLYSEAVIMNSEIEAEALRRHVKWGKEEEFWGYEYNYKSSVASAIHMKARVACGIPGAEKSEEELTEEEKIAIETIEHRRWNAYMRAEGYVYSGSTDKSSRNDLAKTHNDLVAYDLLSEEEKRKDSRVGTA